MNSWNSINRYLSTELNKLSFTPPVTHVYNPLDYAQAPYAQYLEKYGQGTHKFVLLGMNPGPFGMVQTGIPFGEITIVKDWLKIDAPIKTPKKEHPKRPILGWNCTRSEISGKRLWNWAKNRYRTPQQFFKTFFVANYCPLAFMEESGKNRTPNNLNKQEREAITSICDHALVQTIKLVQPEVVIGIGKYAYEQAQKALEDLPCRIVVAPHPSPANPAANKDWAGIFETALKNERIL